MAEVALAVYFAQPVTLRTVDMGRLWELWRDRYPNAEDQTPLPPMLPETFEVPSFAVSMQVMARPPGSRVWYVAEGGDQLVQVQSDRLVHNWRRTSGEGDSYPTYAALRPEFATDLHDFTEFVVGQGLPEPQIGHAEVIYVNPIPMRALSTPGIARLLAPWSGVYSDDFLPAPEDVRLGIRYRITDPSNGEPVGRLYIEGSPAIRQSSPETEAEEVYILQLSARGKPLGDGIVGALKFLDSGHDWIIRGFTSITNTTMHEEWGRKT